MKKLNQLLLCLGSNREKEKNMERAIHELRSHFSSIQFSEPNYTSPIGHTNQEIYLNRVAIAFTNESKETIQELLKEIESRIGRMPEDKYKHSVPIDIDLLQWNDEILREEEMKRGYVRQGLLSLEKKSSISQKSTGTNVQPDKD